MKNKTYTIDTSVIIEYLDEESPYKDKLRDFFNLLIERKLIGYIPATTVSEVLYSATKIYSIANSVNPNKDSEDFVDWLLHLPGVKLVNINTEISILAGNIRKHAKISLIDCFVLATAKVLKSKPLFLKLEKEMKEYLDILKEYDATFISETNIF